MDVVAHQRTAENDIDENRHTWWLIWREVAIAAASN